LLLLTTGAALLATSSAMWEPAASTENPRVPVSVAVAERFYAAVESYLRTGEAEAIRAVVSPDLEQHPAVPGEAVGVDGLLRSLDSIRAAASGLDLRVERAVASASGSEVTVALRATPGVPATILGRPAPPQLVAAGWGSIEILRIAGGRIVERWHGETPESSFVPLAEAALPRADDSAPRVVSAIELTIAGNGAVELVNGFTTRLLYVDAGSVRMTPIVELPTIPARTGLPLPEATAPAIVARELGAGSSSLTVPGDRYRLANLTSRPARLLVIVRHGISSSQGPEPGDDPDLAALMSQPPAGIVATLLSRLSLTIHEFESVAVGRVALSAGAELSWSAAAGTLIAIVCGGTRIATGSSGELTHDGGDALVLFPGESGHWSAPEGAEVLLIGWFETPSPGQPTPGA
jgi:hypothetical protein